MVALSILYISLSAILLIAGEICLFWIAKGLSLGAFIFSLITVAILGLVLFGLSYLWKKWDCSKRLARRGELKFILESISAWILLTLGFMLRMSFIGHMPVTLDADGQMVFTAARVLSGLESFEAGEGVRQYMALLPETYLYPRILGSLYEFFGYSEMAIPCLNVVLSILSSCFLWRAARKAAGSKAGLICLFFACFSPSQILFLNHGAPEYLFLFFFVLSLYLYEVLREFVLEKRSLKANWTRLERFLFLGLSGMMGIVLSLLAKSASQGMMISFIFLALCILGFQKLSISWPKPLGTDSSIPKQTGRPAKPKFSWPKLSMQGFWKRPGIPALVVFVICTSLLNLSIDRELGMESAKGLYAYGYSLLSGANLDSVGSFNSKDSDYLYSRLQDNGSALDTQKDCFDLAGKRRQEAGGRFLGLVLNKFAVLMSRDSFAGEMVFMAGEWTLLWLLLFSCAGLIIMYFKGDSRLSHLALIIFLSLIFFVYFECRERYHFYLIAALQILTGYSYNEIFQKRKPCHDVTTQPRV